MDLEHFRRYQLILHLKWVIITLLAMWEAQILKHGAKRSNKWVYLMVEYVLEGSFSKIKMHVHSRYKFKEEWSYRAHPMVVAKDCMEMDVSSSQGKITWALKMKDRQRKAIMKDKCSTINWQLVLCKIIISNFNRILSTITKNELRMLYSMKDRWWESHKS